MQMSVFEDVVHWCEEITQLLEKEISVCTANMFCYVTKQIELGWFN